MSARPGQASGQGAGRDAPRRGAAAAGRSGPATAAPVIYKHFASKSALVDALISVGFEEQAVLFEAALTSDHPLTAMAGIYRAYGRDNPNLYRLMYDRDLERPLLLP